MLPSTESNLSLLHVTSDPLNSIDLEPGVDDLLTTVDPMTSVDVYSSVSSITSASITQTTCEVPSLDPFLAPPLGPSAAPSTSPSLVPSLVPSEPTSSSACRLRVDIATLIPNDTDYVSVALDDHTPPPTAMRDGAFTSSNTTTTSAGGASVGVGEQRTTSAAAASATCGSRTVSHRATATRSLEDNMSLTHCLEIASKGADIAGKGGDIAGDRVSDHPCISVSPGYGQADFSVASIFSSTSDCEEGIRPRRCHRVDLPRSYELGGSSDITHGSNERCRGEVSTNDSLLDQSNVSYLQSTAYGNDGKVGINEIRTPNKPAVGMSETERSIKHQQDLSKDKTSRKDPKYGNATSAESFASHKGISLVENKSGSSSKKKIFPAALFDSPYKVITPAKVTRNTSSGYRLVDGY